MKNLSAKDHEHCVTALRFYLYVTREITRTEISEKTGIKISLLSHLINKIRVGSVENWRSIAKCFGLSLSEFTEFGSTRLDPGIKPESEIEWEHYKTIRRFSNKQAAKDLNHILVEYEKINPHILYKLITELQKEIDDVNI